MQPFVAPVVCCAELDDGAESIVILCLQERGKKKKVEAFFVCSCLFL